MNRTATARLRELRRRTVALQHARVPPLRGDPRLAPAAAVIARRPLDPPPSPSPRTSSPSSTRWTSGPRWLIRPLQGARWVLIIVGGGRCSPPALYDGPGGGHPGRGRSAARNAAVRKLSDVRGV